MRAATDLDEDAALTADRTAAELDERDSDQIAAEIEQTRSEMTDTVDAIQKKLSPERLVDQVLDSMRDALDDGSDRILYTMRQHPIVTSLIGVGVGWLLLQSTERSRVRSHSAVGQYPYTSEYASEGPSLKERAGGMAHSAAESVKQGAASVRDKASQVGSDLASGAREQASHLTEQARDRASQLGDQLKDQASRVKEQVKEQAGYLGTAARDQARRTASRLGDIAYENPLATAVAGLALGAVIGLLIPETRKEEELMGEARDDLLGKAKEAADDAMQRVQRVAAAAKDAALDEAEKQDLTPEALAAKAREAGRSAAEKVEAATGASDSVP